MQARAFPAAQGWHWLRGGLALWWTAPGVLSLAAFAAILISVVPGALPWVGPLLVCMAAPFVDVVLLDLCHRVRHRRPADMPALRARLLQNGQALLVLGVVIFVSLTLARLLRDALAGTDVDRWMVEAASGRARSVPGSVVLGTVVYWASAALVGLLMWMAPPLVAFGAQPPLKALFFAVVGCWRNRGAFFLFGLSLMALSIPLGLLMVFGALGQMLIMMIFLGVVAPACIAANYLSFQDIFGPLPGSPDAD